MDVRHENALIANIFAAKILAAMVALLLFSSLCPPQALGAGNTYYVSPGGSGNGSASAPFGKIQDALDLAQAGDTVLIAPGTYNESVTTVQSGTAQAPIVIRAEQGRGSVIVTWDGTVFQTRKWQPQEYITVDGIIFDGQYGAADTFDLHVEANHFILTNSEVRRSGRDCIDMASSDNVTIENSLIHHCLWWDGTRKDAHAIAAGGNGRLENLTLRNLEIHTFSGDGFQIDPNRNANGWDNVVIENVTFWLKPFAAGDETNGFPIGSVPGENAIDTKTAAAAPRGRIFVRNTTAFGFKNGFIDVMAAFNMKEKIDAHFDRVTVFDSQYAFRLRGKDSEGYSWNTIQNAVVYDCEYAFRLEENVENLKIYNSTLGSGITHQFEYADPLGQSNPLEIRSLLVLGVSINYPSAIMNALTATNNLAADPSFFQDTATHNYHLKPGSSAIDAGFTIPGVTLDRDAVSRPQGNAYDIGAYEHIRVGTIPPAPPRNFRSP